MSQIPVDNIQSKDGLRRSTFSKFLLDVAREADASQGVVIGLEGPWGSGKSWVLSSLCRYVEILPEDERPVLIEFNPWMLTGADDMVAALLQQLKAQLQSTQPSRLGFAKSAIEKIGAYAQALTTLKHIAPALNLVLPGAGLAVEAITNAAANSKEIANSTSPLLASSPPAPSLRYLRQEIDAALKSAPSRLIVLVDDLDRVSPSEVATVVQAVKAVANFPNTVYMLAYDPVVISNALETQLGIKDGIQYLEKIIQVPISLPELPAARMQRWASEKLSASVAKEFISVAEARDLEFAVPIAAAMMQTPRDAQRLETRLKVSNPHLANRVNLADIMVAEALSLKFPQFYRWVTQHSSSLLVSAKRFDQSIFEEGWLVAVMATTIQAPKKESKQGKQKHPRLGKR